MVELDKQLTSQDLKFLRAIKVSTLGVDRKAIAEKVRQQYAGVGEGFGIATADPAAILRREVADANESALNLLGIAQEFERERDQWRNAYSGAAANYASASDYIVRQDQVADEVTESRNLWRFGFFVMGALALGMFVLWQVALYKIHSTGL